MNAAELATEISAYLLPLLPYFIKGIKIVGREFVTGAGSSLGEKAVEKLQEIWNELWTKIKENPNDVQITTQVAENVDEEGAKVALEQELEKLLQNQLFRTQIETLLGEAKNQGLTVESVQYLRHVAGKVTGITIGSASDAQESGITSLSSHQAADVVEKGGEVIGIEIGRKSNKKRTNSKKDA